MSQLGSLLLGYIRTLINPFASVLAEVPDPLRQDVTDVAGTHLVGSFDSESRFSRMPSLAASEMLRPASWLRSGNAGQPHDSVEQGRIKPRIEQTLPPTPAYLNRSFQHDGLSCGLRDGQLTC